MTYALAVVYLAALDRAVHQCMNNTCVKLKDETEPKAISVDGSGKLWALSPSGRVVYWDNRWKSFDESSVATSLAVKQDGTPYIVGTTTLVYKWSGSSWDQVPDSKKTKAFAFDGDDNMWVIDTSNNVWYSYANKWYEFPGADSATAIAVTKDSDAYIIGAASKIYKSTMKGWKELPDTLAVDIAVDTYGTLWAIGFDNRVWYLDDNDVWRHYGGALKGSEIAVF